jgi:hypothetical protein
VIFDRCSAAAVLAAAVALGAAPAGNASGQGPTPIPDRYCHSVRAQGQTWGVDGTGPRCVFMRGWTVRWLDKGQQPARWRCVDIGDSGECDKHGSPSFFEYYVFD